MLLMFFTKTRTKENRLIFYGVSISLLGDISLMFKDEFIF